MEEGRERGKGVRKKKGRERVERRVEEKKGKRRKGEKKKKKKKKRGHPDLNRGPLDLQSNALPLSYTPTSICQWYKYGIYMHALWS